MRCPSYSGAIRENTINRYQPLDGEDFEVVAKHPVSTMYWTLELASYLEDAPWPATKDELIDYASRTGAPLEVIQNLREMQDDGEPYENIEEIWPDYPTRNDDFYFEEE